MRGLLPQAPLTAPNPSLPESHTDTHPAELSTKAPGHRLTNQGLRFLEEIACLLPGSHVKESL